VKKPNVVVGLVLVAVLLLGALNVGAQDMMDAPARVRVAHFAVDAPAVDVFVAGEAVLEGVPYPAISDYLSLEAGAVEIAVAPAGEGIDAAVIGPVELEFAAGHAYTIAATGQLADDSFGPLVIDETLAFEGEMMGEAEMAEDMPLNARVLVLHGISDAPAVDVITADGTPLIEGAAFNQYATLEVPAGEYALQVTAAGDPSTVVFDLGTLALAGDQYTLVAAIGSFAGENQIFSAVAGCKTIAEVAADYGFSTLVAAVGAAGLGETLTTGGPFTIFAPTDEAFAAALEALGISAEDLLADTETLPSILLYHVVDGTVLAEDVIGLEAAPTLNGAEIGIMASDMGVSLNESATVIATDVLATNGVIHVIDAVLLPPAG